MAYTISKIYAARMKIGMSQRDIARAMNVAPSTITRWENGHMRIAAEKVAALAKILKLKRSDLRPDLF